MGRVWNVRFRGAEFLREEGQWRVVIGFGEPAEQETFVSWMLYGAEGERRREIELRAISEFGMAMQEIAQACRDHVEARGQRSQS